MVLASNFLLVPRDGERQAAAALIDVDRLLYPDDAGGGLHEQAIRDEMVARGIL